MKKKAYWSLFTFESEATIMLNKNICQKTKLANAGNVTDQSTDNTVCRFARQNTLPHPLSRLCAWCYCELQCYC